MNTLCGNRDMMSVNALRRNWDFVSVNALRGNRDIVYMNALRWNREIESMRALRGNRDIVSVDAQRGNKDIVSVNALPVGAESGRKLRRRSCAARDCYVRNIYWDTKVQNLHTISGNSKIMSLSSLNRNTVSLQMR
jgi:hypothetical protein